EGAAGAGGAGDVAAAVLGAIGLDGNLHAESQRPGGAGPRRADRLSRARHRLRLGFSGQEHGQRRRGRPVLGAAGNQTPRPPTGGLRLRRRGGLAPILPALICPPTDTTMLREPAALQLHRRAQRSSINSERARGEAAGEEAGSAKAGSRRTALQSGSRAAGWRKTHLLRPKTHSTRLARVLDVARARA